MADIIKNKASIIFDGDMVINTCETSTEIQPGIKVSEKCLNTSEGYILKDMIATYEIEVYNYSALNITGIVVEDIFTKPDNRIVTFMMISSTSHPSQLAPPTIEGLKVQYEPFDLAPYTSMKIQYDVEFDGLSVGDIMKNSSKAAFAENPAGKPDPSSQEISLQVSYADVEAKKAVSKEAVLDGGDLNYTLTFKNSGNKAALVTTIKDYIPTGFVVKDDGAAAPDTDYIGVTAKMRDLDGTNPVLLTRGTDFTVTIVEAGGSPPEEKHILITNVNSKLNIQGGKILEINIDGTVNIL